jgi:uncharacterized protein (TIGR02246 family)
MRTLKAALLALCFAASSAQATLDENTLDAIRAVWESQQKALDSHDIDGIMATYSDQDDIMLLGTGPGEHWVGQDEIKDAYAHFVESFDARTMQAKCGEGSGSTEGNVFWLSAVCDFTDQKGEEGRHYIINLSAVLVKQGDAWRFHSMHFSHLTDAQQQLSQ